MNDYEVTYILRPSLEEAEVEERANAIAEIIKNQGGQVTGVERLGKKRLAYEISDAREGNYVVMQFQSDPAASKELERQLKLHEEVLRALVIRLDAKMLAHMAALAAAAPPAPAPLPGSVSATYVPHS
jgi:small subunit ribosomal protein S6